MNVNAVKHQAKLLEWKGRVADYRSSGMSVKHWCEENDCSPGRIKCSQKLPLEIKITPETRFHLIAIAHGAEESCKAYFSGEDGGLLIDNQIVGDMHIGKDCEPFRIGQ